MHIPSLIATISLAMALPATAQIANTPEIAELLPGLGRDLGPEMVSATQSAYAALHDRDETGLSVARDLEYGSDPRHRLDIYAPHDTSDSPVLIFVHGGGFVRGDKADVANIGRYAAHHGLIGVTINYRFAPENSWPAGALDLAAALDWLDDNITGYGGNPNCLIIAGNSAGAMHVADYAFRPELRTGSGGVLGAILISPPTVDLSAREIDPARDALYYGVEGDRAAQSVVNAVSGTDLPVMIAYAEHEPDVIIDQTRLMIEAITKRDSRLPLISSAPGHNHISVVAHIGTRDETLGPDLLEFISILTNPQCSNG